MKNVRAVLLALLSLASALLWAQPSLHTNHTQAANVAVTDSAVQHLR